MSESPQSVVEESRVMEGTSLAEENSAGHHSGGDASCTDVKTLNPPVLGTPETPSTSQTAVTEPAFQDNHVEMSQEEAKEEDGNPVKENTQEKDQDSVDNKQEKDQHMEHGQEVAVEEKRKAENMEEENPHVSQEEKEPESGEMRQQGLDIRQKPDVQQCDAKSGEEKGELKGDENMTDKKHHIGQREDEEAQLEDTRHQDQEADQDTEEKKAGQPLGEPKVEDLKSKQKDVDKEEKNGSQETDRGFQEKDSGQHKEETVMDDKTTEHQHGQEEEVDHQGQDVALETDQRFGLEKRVQEHAELKEVDRKSMEKTIKEAKDEIEQVKQETSEESETMQNKEQHSETEEMEVENDEEPRAGEKENEAKTQDYTIKIIEDDFEAQMDVDDMQKKMQEDVSERSDSGKNVESLSKEVRPESMSSETQAQTSEVSSQDMSPNRSENQTIQDLKDEVMESSIQTPVNPVLPVEEAEKMDFDSSSVLSVKVKDEPMDDEYEKALVPPESTGTVKDEPDTSEECDQRTEDEFKISAVYSVGRNSAGSGTSSAKASSSTSASAPALTSASSLCVICSGCKKVLLKGQTAFQRKGSPQLFCSPQCLCTTASDLVKPTKKICHYCLKEILNPKDLIIAPVDSAGAVKDFCSQNCLSAFNYKRESAKTALATDASSIKCSMCQKACTTRHEVNFLGSVHKLCSDACFNEFRATNKLTMNCCVHCGGYCYSSDGQCPLLALEDTVKKFCSQKCIAAFKKKYGKPVPCTMCRGYHSMAEMVESANAEGVKELFCSSSCVTAHKVQSVSSSGAAVECNNCKLTEVPQYHLAMSDGSIRNFCSFNCVVSFQDSFTKTSSQNQSNAATPSVSSTLVQSAPKPASSKPVFAGPSSSGISQIPAVTKISCAQCQRLFFRKPELLEFKGKMYTFCDKGCIEEFKRTNYIMAQCVYCKIEKVVKEIKRINNVDCSFCSEGCKLLYKHDLAKRWGKRHCRSCLYCNSTSISVVTSLFAGKLEEFCGNECLSQYTLIFCQVAKCFMCKRAKKMVESVRWLGEMKHFCGLQCLMYFCSLQGNSTAAGKATIQPSQPTVTQASTGPVLQTTPNTATKEATPVIANVISLSNATNGQPNVKGNAALQGSVPAGVKLIGHASTQTDALKHLQAPPRILKNKALLCKPMSLNKGTSCKPNTCDMNIQTDPPPPDVVIVPLPVPVFVPVPMNLYTQYTPHAVGLPLPVPVPMFLPTTLDSAEKIVETIQKIKEKIPDDPLEADLIMMAEMVAEDNEKEKAVSHGDQDDNFIEDFDLEALSSHLSWEEDSVPSAPRSSRTSEPDKAPPSKKANRSPSPTRTPTPTPKEPEMDLEADFPFDVELSPKDKSAASKQRPRRKGRDGFPQKKRARKRTLSSSSSTGLPNPSKLHHEYGVQAWKSWIRWRNSQPNMQTPKIGSRNVQLKEDLLQCSTAELSYGLSKFVNEVLRPNGEMYSPDSIHYLCLGIQQHLFENGRMENIFADLYYSKFSQSITNILKGWTPTILPSGYVHSRVEEEYLWTCKQLGAFSPSVLLNTLLYFCTKVFNFKTLAQHRRLSFAHVIRCTRSHNNNKVACLRFYPPVPREKSSNADGVPAKRKREDEEEENGVMEMLENAENPLRCPVRLYEFYLSKCSSSVKQRTNVFYLRPERSCVPNSPLWFSSMALDDEELETMLTRILTVRELYVERETPTSVSDSDNETDSD